MHTVVITLARFWMSRLAVGAAACCSGLGLTTATCATGPQQLSRILDADVDLDGSRRPPGDSVSVAAFVAPGTENASFEVRAFIVSGDDNETQEEVKAKGDGFRDAAGCFLARSTLVKDRQAVPPPHVEHPERPAKTTNA